VEGLIPDLDQMPRVGAEAEPRHANCSCSHFDRTE
jgi:hypothetical protein